MTVIVQHDFVSSTLHDSDRSYFFPSTSVPQNKESAFSDNLLIVLFLDFFICFCSNLAQKAILLHKPQLSVIIAVAKLKLVLRLGAYTQSVGNFLGGDVSSFM